MRKLVVRSRTEGGDIAATYGDVLVFIYVTPRMDDGLEQMFALAEAEVATGPRGVFSCIHEGVRAPAPELRDRLSGMLRRRAESLLGVATVLRGSGFRVAALRSMIAGVRLVSRGRYPGKVFSESDPAAAWLAARVPHLAAGELADLARSLEPVAVSAAAKPHSG